MTSGPDPSRKYPVRTNLGIVLWLLYRSGIGKPITEPVCAKCKYAIKGLVGDKCPECGAFFEESGVVVPHENATQRTIRASFSAIVSGIMFVPLTLAMNWVVVSFLIPGTYELQRTIVIGSTTNPVVSADIRWIVSQDVWGRDQPDLTTKPIEEIQFILLRDDEISFPLADVLSKEEINQRLISNYGDRLSSEQRNLASRLIHECFQAHPDEVRSLITTYPEYEIAHQFSNYVYDPLLIDDEIGGILTLIAIIVWAILVYRIFSKSKLESMRVSTP